MEMCAALHRCFYVRVCVISNGKPSNLMNAACSATSATRHPNRRPLLILTIFHIWMNLKMWKLLRPNFSAAHTDRCCACIWCISLSLSLARPLSLWRHSANNIVVSKWEEKKRSNWHANIRAATFSSIKRSRICRFAMCFSTHSK